MTAQGSKYFATHVVHQTLFVVPSRNVASLTGVELAKERSAFIDQMRNSNVREVIFDLSALEAFGSLMLGTLCLTWKQARDQGAAMALCNVSATGRQVLERSRLSSLWPIHASRDLAVESLGTAGGRRVHSPTPIPRFLESSKQRPAVVCRLSSAGHELFWGLAAQTFAPNTSSDNTSRDLRTHCDEPVQRALASTSPE